MTMSFPSTADHTGRAEDVVGVELTIDGVLVLAEALGLADFPTSLGIRPNIPQEDVREAVRQQVQQDLTAQGVMDAHGRPHPAVATMIHTVSAPDRMLEGRWWRRDVGDVMVRFTICRKGEGHVIAVRDDDLLVLQRVTPQIGLAGMVTCVLGEAGPATVEPLTGVAADLAHCTTAEQLADFGIDPHSADVYARITGNPSAWVEIIAGQRMPDGTPTQTTVAAGVVDSEQGRVVSAPRRIAGELYGSFLPGTAENLQRCLDELLQFLPAGAWFDDGTRCSNE